MHYRDTSSSELESYTCQTLVKVHIVDDLIYVAHAKVNTTNHNTSANSNNVIDMLAIAVAVDSL